VVARMNDQIKELMIQADIPFEMEQITELILSYCFDYCEDNFSHELSNALRNHFGLQ
jgi:hypothetical protein